MMYGFGDDSSPRPDSVDLVEDMVVEYLTDIVILSFPFKNFIDLKF